MAGTTREVRGITFRKFTVCIALFGGFLLTNGLLFPSVFPILCLQERNETNINEKIATTYSVETLSTEKNAEKPVLEKQNSQSAQSVADLDGKSERDTATSESCEESSSSKKQEKNSKPAPENSYQSLQPEASSRQFSPVTAQRKLPFPFNLFEHAPEPSSIPDRNAWKSPEAEIQPLTENDLPPLQELAEQETSGTEGGFHDETEIYPPMLQTISAGELPALEEVPENLSIGTNSTEIDAREETSVATTSVDTTSVPDFSLQRTGPEWANTIDVKALDRPGYIASTAVFKDEGERGVLEVVAIEDISPEETAEDYGNFSPISLEEAPISSHFGISQPVVVMAEKVPFGDPDAVGLEILPDDGVQVQSHATSEEGESDGLEILPEQDALLEKKLETPEIWDFPPTQ